MKRFGIFAAITLAALSLSGCFSMQSEYNAVYDATCPAPSFEDMQSKLKAIAEGTAERLNLSRPSVRRIDSWNLVSYVKWDIPAAPGGKPNRGTIIFSYSDTPGTFVDTKNTISAVILKYPNEEDTQLAKVRAAIEAEYRRAGCTPSDYRLQLKLS